MTDSEVSSAEDSALDLGRLPQATLLRALLDHFPSGSVNVFDRDLRYVLAAGQGLAAVGLSAEQLIGKRLDELFPPDAVAYVTPFYRRALAGEALSFELAFSDHVYTIRVAPLTQPDGTVPALLAVAEDMTGQKQLETELRQLVVQEQAARSTAEAAVQLRDEVLSLVSHDLKSPLAVIQLSAQRLQRLLAPLPEAAAAAVHTGLTQINEMVARMATQIDTVLEVAQIEAGQEVVLHCRSTDLVALVQRSVAAEQQRAPQQPIQYEPAVATLIAAIDAGRLERVISNLLDNAIKYSAAGAPIYVRLGMERAEPGAWAVLTVQDHGIGIPAAELEQIFKPFHRARNVRDCVRGSGLGLASAQQIIRQHGGTIRIESVEGMGTTVTVRLPCDVGAQPAHDRPMEPARSR